MQHWHHATLAPCSIGTMQHWHHAAFAPCCICTMQHWHHAASRIGIMQQTPFVAYTTFKWLQATEQHFECPLPPPQSGGVQLGALHVSQGLILIS
jgi:hypothetical protein